MVKRFTAIVRGRVQGVLFRDFTHRKARKFGLVGTVENLPDGSVKVVAEGEEEILNQFLSKLRKGSLLSHVENVVVDWSEPTNSFKDFKIVYHGLLDHL